MPTRPFQYRSPAALEAGLLTIAIATSAITNGLFIVDRVCLAAERAAHG